MKAKDEFLNLYKGISRPGAEKLLHALEQSDFFTAPASTRFHEAYASGLCEHSVRVFHELLRLAKAYPEQTLSEDSLLVVSLLHDVCKVGCYKTEMRNRKNEQGMWEKVPFYTFQEDFAFGGHGSKSVFILQKYIRLTDAEAAAINCHMGVENGNFAVYDAFRQFPLAFLLHTADVAATIPLFQKEDGAQ